MMKWHLVTAVLYEVGINFCMDVPPGICEALGKDGYIPVVASAAGTSVRTTLLPAGRGRYRLYLNGALRKAADMQSGEMANVLLRRDEESREIPTPKDVSAALKQTPGAQAVFNKLTPALRREFLNWVLNAKQSETRERRIQKGIETIMSRAMKASGSGHKAKTKHD
ncbi:MAG TPA: YdeI/OmpD-associated family protein [Blastocatellia bacterium]|nr:YdeI/OmpD-associated family protein [Blastocatellia bacterium]